MLIGRIVTSIYLVNKQSFLLSSSLCTSGYSPLNFGAPRMTGLFALLKVTTADIWFRLGLARNKPLIRCKNTPQMLERPLLACTVNSESRQSSIWRW